MVLKTFNVQEAVYNEFSKFCKDNGISMSKQVDNFMSSFVSEPEVRPEYLKKLEQIRKKEGIRFSSVGELRKKIENA